jgi:hypothetical protein
MATQRELAEKYSLDVSAVNRLKKNGVDIQNAGEVREAVLKQAKFPASWQNGCPWHVNGSGSLFIETLEQIAEYHYVSIELVEWLQSEGINVHRHRDFHVATMKLTVRPLSWVNGNPNWYETDFPNVSDFPERDYLICYCESDCEDTCCVSCRAEEDNNHKYFRRNIENEEKEVASAEH